MARPKEFDTDAALEKAMELFWLQGYQATTLPDLAEFHKMLEQIWDRRWLTNDGPLHRELEAAVARHLGVEHLSLFCNGTQALLVALQALRARGGPLRSHGGDGGHAGRNGRLPREAQGRLERVLNPTIRSVFHAGDCA